MSIPSQSTQQPKASSSQAQPEVSIITPCYNASSTLARTVESILQQTFTDWELLLVDDCSSDDTCERAEPFSQHDSRIILVRQQHNGGAARARNKGIELAKGRYIAFLDADDSWHPEKLERQLKLMQANNWPLSFTSYTRIGENGEIINQVGVPETVTYRELLKTNVIGCSTAIYDTAAVGKVTMPDMRKRQDFGLWLKILKLTPKAYGINSEPLTTYRVMSNSLSSNKGKTAGYNWHLYRQEEGLSLIKASYYFAHYALRGVLRSRLPAAAKLLGWLHTPQTGHDSIKTEKAD